MSALKIVLYKNKQLANGENPIHLRVYFGTERYISLGMSAKPSDWNDKYGRFNANLYCAKPPSCISNAFKPCTTFAKALTTGWGRATKRNGLSKGGHGARRVQHLIVIGVGAGDVVGEAGLCYKNGIQH